MFNYVFRGIRGVVRHECTILARRVCFCPFCSRELGPNGFFLARFQLIRAVREARHAPHNKEIVPWREDGVLLFYVDRNVFCVTSVARFAPFHVGRRVEGIGVYYGVGVLLCRLVVS